MNDIFIPPETMAQLEEAARDDQRNLADVLNDAIKEFIARRRREKISQESARCRAQYRQLWEKYNGQYIAMKDGEVVDHDENASALFQRVRAKYGNTPVMIAPLLSAEIPEYRILSPRIENIRP